MQKSTSSISSVIKVKPKIEGLPIDMEVDTGTAVSLISSEMYRAKLSHILLRHTSIVLKTYTGEVISLEGVIKVHVKMNEQSVRIFGDFKITVNPALCVEHYPLPQIEDLFASLAGGQRFSKLDLSHAYLQVPVNENSHKYLTITTHKGMFSYNRLPFGITSAPSIFQRVIEQVLQGLPYVICFLDDILVTGKDDGHHLTNLETVLSRLQKFGLHVKPEKSEFFKSSLEYLGHVIDAAGLHKSPDKLHAIAEAPAPVNVSQLGSFLGLINYYARFVPNLATILHPLNAMLHKDIKWNWSLDSEESFQDAKAQLLTPSVLTHYDQRLPVRLACDASP